MPKKRFSVEHIAVGVSHAGANYHFLSDVIACAFIGISTGWMAAAIWKVSAAAGAQNAK